MTHLTESQIEKIENFLKSLNTEVDILDHVDIDEIEFNAAYDSIYNMIENCGGFDIEIIYYGKAMEYLMQNDCSLSESLRIADELGYEAKNLNSEILASLLASQNSREEFSNLIDEIDDFFTELQEEIDN